MPEGDTIHRTASALRTAMAGRRMQRFDAPELVGPVPVAGRVIEAIEIRGRHLEMVFDDGLVLDTQVRRGASWHLHRPDEPWRRPFREMSAAVETTDWVAVCFNAPLVETYRQPDRRRHPGMGRIGPDLTHHDVDVDRVVDLLVGYADGEAALAEVLLDQRVACGLGNVYRCEAMWATGVSPFAHVGVIDRRDAHRLVSTAVAQLRVNLQRPGRIAVADVKGGLAVYGRNGQRCPRCPGTIEGRRGRSGRVLYWCPQCQVQHGPDRGRRDGSADRSAVMDPHPAAQRFLADLPWNRDVG